MIIINVNFLVLELNFTVVQCFLRIPCWPAVNLCSNRSSKCDKNKKVVHEAQPSVSLKFKPHFDVPHILTEHTSGNMKSTSICLHDKEVKCFNDDNIFLSVLSWVISKNQSKCVFNSAYY